MDNKIREDFPIFDQKVNGHPFIFLDSAATSQKPHQVIDVVASFYETYCSNVGRGVYYFAEQTTARYEQVRKQVATFFNTHTDEIVFTKGATEGINFVATAWAMQHVQEGDQILVSEVEHHSNLIPWQQVAQAKRAQLIKIPLNVQGTIDIDAYESALSERTKIVAFVHTSNILGTTNDAALLTKMAHQHDAKVLIDGCQSAPHMAIDLSQIDCDFFVCSGHKMLAPTGVGVLYISRDIHHEMKPYQFGGSMVFSADYEDATFKEPPHCFEAGTPAIGSIIGLGKALEYLDTVDFAAVKRHETALMKMLYDFLKQYDHIQIISPEPSSASPTHLVTFASEKIHAHDIAAYADQKGIALRAGHHCVQPFLAKKNISASVRASVYLYNTQADIKALIDVLTDLFK